LANDRVLLHFGAVDYIARVWVNDRLATVHEGGYTPFYADITHLLDPSGRQTITVQVEDDPFDLAKPRGKQDWQLTPHSIWYPANHRHLADRVARARAAHLHPQGAMDAEDERLLDHLRRAHRRRRDRAAARRRHARPRRARARRRSLSRAGRRGRPSHHPLRPGIDDYRNELCGVPSGPRSSMRASAWSQAIASSTR
jgi:hypothetical protein